MKKTKMSVFMIGLMSMMLATTAVASIPGEHREEATLSGSKVYGYSSASSFSSAVAGTYSYYSSGSVALNSTCYQYSNTSHTVTPQTQNKTGQYSCNASFSAISNSYRIVQMESSHAVNKLGQTWTARTHLEL